MRDKAFKVLRCPICVQPFSVWNIENGSVINWGANFSGDIASGLLKCAEGHFFPIVASIPRIFPGSLSGASELTAIDQPNFPKDWKDAVAHALYAADHEFNSSFLSTQKSFSSEWAGLGEDESAWGQNVDDRLKLFLESFQIKKQDLIGKLILDAGCGHGENTLALAQAGAKVFAIDLSTSVDIVAKRVKKAGLGDSVTLVQTNLSNPPFVPGTFDFVYSGGVLHHTPNTHKSFQGIAPLVKTGGLTFIEVYSNEFKNLPELVIHFLFRGFRKLTLLLPLSLLHTLCWVLAFPFWLYIHFANWITRNTRYIPRSLSGMKLSLFDALSPRYDWHHTTNEVRNWFVEAGYLDLARTYENHNCIGIVGRKSAI